MSAYIVAFDETESSKGHFTLGGWLGPDEDWSNQFEPAWGERVLEGPPRIPYLHQTDIRNEEWRTQHNLSGDEAYQRVDEAVRVIDSMGSLYPITASMHAHEFRESFGDPLKKAGGFGEIPTRPDYLAYIAFVSSVLEWAGKKIPDATRVDFLAENSEKTTRVLKHFHDALREVLPSLTAFPHLLGEFGSAGKESIPLQAADLFCWLHQRADAGRLHTLDVRRLRRLTHRRGFPFDIDAAQLKDLAEARDDSVSYPRGLIWIDKQNMMPLRQELFALPGMMLKIWIMSEIEMISGRPVARRMEISDQLKQSSRTVFSLEEVSFGVELESEIFTRRWLERN